jgi:2-polyprenyl-6-methoxyphenol hydroxylase-like FAD-dependent oxidoreductase
VTAATDLEIPVLIVGGSLVGMSSALLLGHHGVRSLTVEHHRGTAIHPRAALISQRTMEVFRTVGVEQIVRSKSDEQFVQDGAIMAVETLTGKELAYFNATLNDGVRDVSPCERLFISQTLLEPLLKARAQELGAELRFATEMASFEQDASGVTAVTRHRDTGAAQTIRAKYMIAADGAHSRVRQRLGIPMKGHGSFAKCITIYFRASIEPLLAGRNLSVIYVNNPALRGFFRFEKPFQSGFLAVWALGDPANPVTDVSTGLTEERCRDLVHTAFGTDRVPVRIDNVMHWEAEANTAERFRDGRIFLAGDSAHVMPPTGGFGGNTGVQDAHNLAWKLAMVLRGEAGPELLDTYEAERWPAAYFTVEQAYARYVTRTAPYLGTAGMQPLADDLEIELGYTYDSSAIEGGSTGHGSPRESKARPGTRAPHCWLTRNGERISTLDLFGRNYVVLAGPDANVTEANAGLHRVEDEACLEAYGLTRTGAVLVRPDGFVAKRLDKPGGV